MQETHDGWNALKKKLHAKNHARTFNEREIWWCSVGFNVGHESNGKNKLYNRPILIIRKFNHYVFLGVPLTTQLKSNPYYYPFYFKGQRQCAMISQLRLWDAKRLTHKMGQLSDDEFQGIKNAIRNMI